jgi:hypothetical protein
MWREPILGDTPSLTLQYDLAWSVVLVVVEMVLVRQESLLTSKYKLLKNLPLKLTDR